MKDYAKYILGILVGATVFAAGVIFAKKHIKKTYAKAPKREYLI